VVEAHKRLIREAMAAFNERDTDRVVAAMHPDSEVELVGGFDGVMGPHFHGEEGSRRFCEEWFTAFKTMEVRIAEYLDAGERILILTELEAMGTGSEVRVDLLGAAIYSFEDEMIRRIEFYYERDRALEDAGL
jgi:ketosteroid isomerase-like protein